MKSSNSSSPSGGVVSIYSNSLTNQVQASIDQRLASFTATARLEWDLRTTAASIQKELVDRSTINTPDFILRRYIQKNFVSFMPGNIPLVDLSTNKNVPWNEDETQNKKIIDAVSDRLFKESKEIGAKISKKEWKKYLAGESSTIKKRDKVFMMAFVLRMDAEDTNELLMAFGQETYSVRHPKDLICLFCQSSPEWYKWSHVEKMYSDFMAMRNPNLQYGVTATKPTDGMTEVIENELNAIFEKNLPVGDAEEELVNYMIANSCEFVSFPKRKYGAKISIEEEFHPGYSTGRMDNMMHLAQYLKRIYPYYYQKEKGAGARYNVVTPQSTRDATVVKTYVENENDGFTNLSSLARAMFSLSGWSEIDWDKSVHRSSIDDTPEKKFEEENQIFCGRYADRYMSSINRLRTRDVNTGFFKRSDALLWIFFLLSGYMAEEVDGIFHSTIKERISDLRQRDTHIDEAVDAALRKAEKIKSKKDKKEQFRMLNTCFDMILFELGYHEMYMPAVLDRLLIMSLLAEDPHKMAAQIMCQVDISNEQECQKIILQVPEDFLAIVTRLAEKRLKEEQNCDYDNYDSDYVVSQSDNGNKEKANKGGSEEKDNTPNLGDLSEASLDDLYYAFLKQIAPIERLSDDEVIELAKKIREGDQGAKEKLIVSNLKLVVSIAAKCYGPGLANLDLIQEGFFGLARAAENYDPKKIDPETNKPYKFSTYATPLIRGAIIHAIQKKGSVIRLPRYMVDRKNKIAMCEKKWEQEYGRKPTSEELATMLNLSVQQIKNAQSTPDSNLSLDSYVGDDEDATIGDFISEDEWLPEEAASNSAIVAVIQESLENLEKWEAALVRLRFGMVDGNMYTLEEVGEAFHVDGEIIRQAEKEIFEKLRRYSAIKKVRNEYLK